MITKNEDWEVVQNNLPGHKKVLVVVEIRLNSTGEIREYVSEEYLEENELHPSTFNWSENNFSCDCNRELFFLRANNETEPEGTGYCIGDGKYSVRLRNKLTGSIYYNEF